MRPRLRGTIIRAAYTEHTSTTHRCRPETRDLGRGGTTVVVAEADVVDVVPDEGLRLPELAAPVVHEDADGGVGVVDEDVQIPAELRLHPLEEGSHILRLAVVAKDGHALPAPRRHLNSPRCVGLKSLGWEGSEDLGGGGLEGGQPLDGALLGVAEGGRAAGDDDGGARRAQLEGDAAADAPGGPRHEARFA